MAGSVTYFAQCQRKGFGEEEDDLEQDKDSPATRHRVDLSAVSRDDGEIDVPEHCDEMCPPPSEVALRDETPDNRTLHRI